MVKPLSNGTAILVALVFGLACLTQTGAAGDCVWLFSAYEGISTTSVLTTQWNCSGILSITTVAPLLNGFFVPNPRNPVVTYTPPTGGVALGTQSQALSVTCDIFTSLCTTATVWYVVRPSSLTTPTPPAPPPTTTPLPTPAPTPLPPGATYAPTTLAPVATPSPPTPVPTTPVPTPAVPVLCKPPTSLIIGLQVAAAAAPSLLGGVSNCNSPTFSFSDNTSSSLFTISADTTSVTFDANATNTVAGVYVGKFNLNCAGALSCVLTQYVVSVAPLVTTTTAAPTPPPTAYAPCVPVYGYDCYYNTVMNLSLVGLSGASTCPPSTNTTSFLLLSSPAVNNASFMLDGTTGAFTYAAPGVMTADAFTFALLCDRSIFCSATVYLITLSNYVSPAPPTTPTPNATSLTPVPSTAAPPTFPPTAAPLPSCIGTFAYIFYYASDSTVFTPQQGNLILSLSPNFTSCSRFSGASLTSGAIYGAVTMPDAANGIFTYSLPSGSPIPTNWDNFTFILSCAVGGYQCAGVASVLVSAAPPGSTPAPTPVPTLVPPVYQINPTLRCSGTCSADAWKAVDAYPSMFDVTPSPINGSTQVTPRKDGRGLDEISFFLNLNSNLVIAAFAKIGNMAARFPTFLPIASGGLLTSGATVGANVAFNASCLDSQITFGTGYAVWKWTNITTLQGYAAGLYAAGSDYYQKFGGKHVNCDTFRKNACQYAPLLSPSNASGINWRLMISDCDVTWIGEASLSALKALRFANGSSVFVPKGNNALTATIYSEVIKPASWLRPSIGTSQLARAYLLNIAVRNLLTLDVSVLLAPMTLISNNSNNTNVTDGSNATTAAPPPPQATFQADVAYSITADAVTNERLYWYNLLLYPTVVSSSSSISSGSFFANVFVVGVRLGSVSVQTPRVADCPQCTGNATTCLGTGIGFSDYCGAAALVTFAAASNGSSVCPNATVLPPVAGVDNVATCPQILYNISFYGRVNGANTANSVQQPEGDVSVLVDFSNGQTVQVTLHQRDYISQASSSFLPSTICRSTPYAPVLDPVGSSTPVNIFAAPTPVIRQDYTVVDKSNVTAPSSVTQFGSPAVNRVTGAAMCYLNDERTFGPTSWVYIGLNTASQPNISVNYVTLTVDAAEVLPNPTSRNVTILLQGSLGPYARFALDWSTYASFINFRSQDTSDGVTSPAFAFVPGTLLRAGSSPRVIVTVQISLSTPNGDTLIRYEIPVAKSITATTRGEQALTPFVAYGLVPAPGPAILPGTSSFGGVSGFSLTIGLMVVVAVLLWLLVSGDDDTYGMMLDQCSSLWGCCGSRESAADDGKPAAAATTTNAATPASALPPGSSTKLKSDDTQYNNRPPKRALTPAAATILKQQQQQQQQGPAAPQAKAKQASPTSPPTAAGVAASPTSVRSRSAPREPETEARRVRHADPEVEPRRVAHDD